MNNIHNNFEKASKWSLLTEIVSKLLPPVTNMILARLLTPGAFGLVATITMVTSFAEIFADAGFQKYLVQAQFTDEKKLNCATNVAFWTNLSVSGLLWILITLFRDRLAMIVGSPGLGLGIAVAAIAIPLTSFSSIQLARYRRSMDFKGIFFVRVFSMLIPLLVTVPLAFALRSYWALVIGNLVTGLTNAVFLTVRSNWRPAFYYNFSLLKEMLSFSMWALLDRLLGWANLNIGIFIVGTLLSEYYLGLYKTSMAYVNQVLDILVNSLSPVLLATLSRMHEDKEDIKPFFYQFEEKMAMFIIPLGIGIFVFRDLFTSVLLGAQWSEASNFIGFWALMRATLIVFGMFGTTVCMAVGKPQFIAIGQAVILVCLIPTIFFSAQIGYEALSLARPLAVLWSVVVYLTIGKIAANISPFKIAKISAPYFLAAIIMGLAGWFFQQISSSIPWHFVAVFLCIILYFAILCMMPRTRKSFLSILRGALGKRFPLKDD